MTSGYTLPERPGQRWAYNDYGIKLYVKTLFDCVYGVSSTDAEAVEALVASRERLGPLGFQDGSLFTIKEGTPRVNMTPRDYARVGWFWLNAGNWNGRRLLPKSFFDEVLQPQVPASMRRTAGGGPDDYLGIGTMGGGNDIHGVGPGHYGFNWWFNASETGDRLWPDVPGDAFEAEGHNHEDAMVMIPSLRMVTAWRGASRIPEELFGSEMNRILKPLVESVEG